MTQQAIQIGQIVKTAYGHIGRVFDTNGTTITVIQDRNDNVYAQIGIFHRSKVFAI